MYVSVAQTGMVHRSTRRIDIRSFSSSSSSFIILFLLYNMAVASCSTSWGERGSRGLVARATTSLAPHATTINNNTNTTNSSSSNNSNSTHRRRCSISTIWYRTLGLLGGEVFVGSTRSGHIGRGASHRGAREQRTTHTIGEHGGRNGGYSAESSAGGAAEPGGEGGPGPLGGRRVLGDATRKETGWIDGSGSGV